MKRAGLFVGLIVAAVASAARASAQEPAANAPPAPAAAAAAATIDIVFLRAGAPLRGRVAELVPDDHVTLVLESGEQRRIAWSEIDRVTLGSSGAGPDAAPPRSADGAILVMPPTPPPATGPRTRVHVSSPRRVSLYRRSSDGGPWVHACASPCDVELPLGDTYRVQGTGVNPSSSFRLEGDSDTTTLTVDPSSTFGEVVGGALATAGAVTAFIGILLLPSKETQGAGAAAAVIGSAVIVGGILIYRSSAKTDVSQRVGEARGASPAPILDAFVREAPRREPPEVAAAILASPARVPVLFEGSF